MKFAPQIRLGIDLGTDGRLPVQPVFTRFEDRSIQSRPRDGPVEVIPAADYLRSARALTCGAAVGLSEESGRPAERRLGPPAGPGSTVPSAFRPLGREGGYENRNTQPRMRL
jgi:hypothetical protein